MNELKRFSDKIGDIILETTDSELSTFKQLLNECDDFSIAFYEWRSTTHVNNIDQYTNKEVLEIFKKEYFIRT